MPLSLNLSEDACPHCWDEAAMVAPRQLAAVHKEDCAYCCRTCKSNDGLFVCMCCHIGLCADHTAKHKSLHSLHTMYVWIREIPVKEEKEPVRDVNKLGVVAPKEYESAICCIECSKRFVAPPELAVDSYQQIINAMSTGAKDTILADGAEFIRPQCPHLVCLEQMPSPFQTEPTASEKCSFDNCECRVNNWMCMTCGAVGCPRKEAGGSGHAVMHNVTTSHPTVVKLGTVTSAGADFYCYSCDDEVSDVHFATHMKHFGIDIHTAKKTAKTLGELQYDYSSQFDFNRITESGESLEPMFGPGRTGMHNFGNSCYLSSVVQCLFALQPFKDAFYKNRETRHQTTCTANPYDCRMCQTERLANGLLSGDFSIREDDLSNGITVREFKRVFAQKHPEFSTAEQQDAQEYFLYLLEQMRRYVKPSTEMAVHPADVFDMTVEQRVQCGSCRKVRYFREKDRCLSLPIPMRLREAKPANVETQKPDAEIEADRPHYSLDMCISALMQPAESECRCSACGKSVTYFSTTRLLTFPDVLPIFVRRAYFDPVTATVKKHDAFVEVPEEISLEPLRGGGLQPGEVEMPNSEDDRTAHRAPASSATEAVDEMALAILLSMGIEDAVARYALQKTDMNAERAIDYVFSRENIAQEMVQAAMSPQTATEPSNSATAATDGPAKYRLRAMISHMGASAKTGHYVCHIKDNASGDWLLFNDEKVARSKNPPYSMASIYFFTRIAN